jgi:hypothetical protein
MVWLAISPAPFGVENVDGAAAAPAPRRLSGDQLPRGRVSQAPLPSRRVPFPACNRLVQLGGRGAGPRGS